jgi:hypothetical protein
MPVHPFSDEGDDSLVCNWRALSVELASCGVTGCIVSDQGTIGHVGLLAQPGADERFWTFSGRRMIYFPAWTVDNCKDVVNPDSQGHGQSRHFPISCLCRPHSPLNIIYIAVFR